MTPLSILLVEDERTLLESIRMNLELEEYDVTAVDDGFGAINAFQENEYNLIILDIILPDMSGLEICQQIRLENQHTPILFITATSRETIFKKIDQIKQYADDILPKPFGLEELLQKVGEMLRDTSQISSFMGTF